MAEEKNKRKKKKKEKKRRRRIVFPFFGILIKLKVTHYIHNYYLFLTLPALLM